MLKFYIDFEERNEAQKRAEELDVNHSDPPGQYPYVWDNGMGCVSLWYDHVSPDGKIGTVFFNPVLEENGQLSRMFECITEITHGSAGPEGNTVRERIADLEEHEKLVEYFFQLLLGRELKGQEVAVLQDISVLKRRIEELEALNQVATILNSAHDLRRVLELAIERIGAALQAEAGSLLLRDEATGELVFAVALGPVAERLRGRRLKPGQGIAGWVADTGKGVLVPDTDTDPRFCVAVDEHSGFVTRSILCAPLRTSKGNIGVVELLNRSEGRLFSRADLQLLETIALHAAAVIEKARLLEREKELTTLLVLSNLAEGFSGPLQSLDCYLEELFNTVAHQNPDMVATVEKAMERVGTIRKLSQRLSGALPEESHEATPSDP